MPEIVVISPSRVFFSHSQPVFPLLSVCILSLPPPPSLSFSLNKSAHVREKHSAFYSAALGGFNPSKLIPFSRSIAHSLCFVLHQLGYVQPALSLGVPALPLPTSSHRQPQRLRCLAEPPPQPLPVEKLYSEPVYKELLIARAAPICINQF